MTSPVDQAQLKAEMETLAKVYVTTQAYAIDSLVNRDITAQHWTTVYSLRIGASELIGKVIQALSNASEVLERL